MMFMSNMTEPEKEVTADVRRAYASVADKPIWEIIDQIISDVPEAVLNSLPTDGAERHDHYLHGTREKET
jgi:hypothetical protein